MSKENTKKPFAWRKWAIIGGFVALIFISLIAWFMTEFFKNRVKPFDGTKLVSESSITDFDFDFYASKYGEPDKDEDSKTLEFSITVSKPKDIDKYTYTALKSTVAIGDKNWTNRYKAGSATTIISTWSSTTSAETKSATPKISSYNYSYPAKRLGIIKISHPTVWLNLTYTKTSLDRQHVYERNYVIQYSWNDYFKNGKSVII